MPSVNQSVLLPYSQQQMFALVADVERYPAFLPWCAGGTVLPQPDGTVMATVTIDFKGIRQSFTTINRNSAPESISMSLASGPFRRLEGQWTFTRLREDACRAEFSLQYEFAGGLLGLALSRVFDHIARSFVDAFVRRADALYGGTR